MKKSKRVFFIVIMGIILFSLIPISSVLVPKLLYINNTDSAQRGIYIRVFDLPQIGDYCIFPTSEIVISIPFSVPETFMKKLVATEGMKAVINDTGVYINEVYYCSRNSYKNIKSIYYSDFIPSGYCLVFNDPDDSFDSRHFGLIPISNLKKVKLLWKF